MDFADIAAEREQLDRTLALQAQANHKPPLRPTGKCYNCKDAVARGLLFCDCYCRDDYDKRMMARARNAV